MLCALKWDVTCDPHLLFWGEAHVQWDRQGLGNWSSDPQLSFTPCKSWAPLGWKVLGRGRFSVRHLMWAIWLTVRSPVSVRWHGPTSLSTCPTIPVSSWGRMMRFRSGRVDLSAEPLPCLWQSSDHLFGYSSYSPTTRIIFRIPMKLKLKGIFGFVTK